MAATKNFMTSGGDEWVIGGKLTILEGAEVEGLDSGAKFTPAASVAKLSPNAELPVVISTVNSIITNLKAAGLMA